MANHSFFQFVYAAVQQIPEGKVATCGDIAAANGSPRAAQAVWMGVARQSGADCYAVPPRSKPVRQAFRELRLRWYRRTPAAT